MRQFSRFLLPVHFQATDEGVDLARDSEEAFSLALPLAKDAGGELTLTHVFENTEDESFSDEGSFRAFQSVLDERVSIAADAGVACDWEFQFGNPAGEIINFAEISDFDLIVMGSRHAVGDGGRLVGTTAGQVMLGSRIPVMIARQKGAVHPRVLIATDLTEECDSVLSTGIAIARTRNAAVHVVHAHSEREGADDALLARLRVELEMQLARVLRGESPPGDLSTEVEFGTAPNVIWNLASSLPVDLVVMGMTGRQGGERVLHLNTAEVVLEDLPCSLMTIPA